MKLIEQLFSLILYWLFYCLYYYQFQFAPFTWIILLILSLCTLVHLFDTWGKATKTNLGLGSFEKEWMYYIHLSGTAIFLLIPVIDFYINNLFDMTPERRLTNPPIGFGIFISVFLGGYLNHWLNKLLWRYLSSHDRKHKDAYSFVNMLGTLEILLYFIALACRRPEFIAFWITTKVAVTWQQFAKSVDRMSSHHVFLIGNSLNILWAIIGVILTFGLNRLIPQ